MKYNLLEERRKLVKIKLTLPLIRKLMDIKLTLSEENLRISC